MPFRFAVSCSLIKCVYLYNKTLKRLCDGGSSAMGLCRCYMATTCLGAYSSACQTDNLWAITQGSTGYYYLTLNYGEVNVRSVNLPYAAFSARCVRYLIKMCLLCIKALKNFVTGSPPLWGRYTVLLIQGVPGR